MAEQRARNKDTVLIEFAKQVRKHRHRLELTQEELAEKSDLHVNYIWD